MPTGTQTSRSGNTVHNTKMDRGRLGIPNIAAGTATGVQFAPVTREQLEVALARTLSLWRNPWQWERLQARGMATDVGWSQSAARYAKLFRDLVGTLAVQGGGRV